MGMNSIEGRHWSCTSWKNLHGEGAKIWRVEGMALRVRKKIRYFGGKRYPHMYVSYNVAEARVRKKVV